MNIFKNYIQNILNIYENNSIFKRKILETTKSVFPQYITDENSVIFLEEAKWYLLKEIAFGLCVNSIFDEKNVLTSYYRDFKIYREFTQSPEDIEYHGDKHQCLIYKCI